MINKTKTIFILYPTVTNIINEVDAYDKDDNKVEIDMVAVESKLVELQDAEESAQAAKAAAEQSAISKLAALGLTADEIAALRGKF